MRVLVAGASGEMGHYLLPALMGAGHEVTGITRRAGSLAGSGAAEVVADVIDRGALLQAVDGLRFDAVIHQATSLKKMRQYSQLFDTNRLRTEGTSALLAVARATGATKFVSASAFFGYGFGDFGDKPLDESASFGEAPGGPIDPVFRALLSNEQQTRAFGGVALRYGIFYRARGPIPPVPSAWNGTLPFIHLEDAAAATVAALAATPGSAFNIVDDTPTSWRELHEARAHVFDLPDPTRLPAWLFRRAAPFTAELLTQTSMRVPNTRARDDFGWTPAYPSYREGLAAALTDAARARAALAAPAAGAARGTAPGSA